MSWVEGPSKCQKSKMPHNKTVWEGLGCMALEEVCHWGGKFRGIKSHVRPSITPHTRAQCLLPLPYAPHHDDDGLWPSDPVSMPQLNDLIYQLPLVSVSPHRSRIGTKTPPNWHQPLGPDVCSAHCASCGHKLAHSLKPLLPHTHSAHHALQCHASSFSTAVAT